MRPEMAGTLRRCRNKMNRANTNQMLFGNRKKWASVLNRWNAKLFKQLNKPENKSNWYWAY